MNTPPSLDHIMQTGMAFWASKTVLSAVALGVFTELGSGPLDAESLRQRLGLHPRSAVDFFDALVALKFLQRENGRYANTPDTAFFLDRHKPNVRAHGYQRARRALLAPPHGRNVMQVKQVEGRGPTQGTSKRSARNFSMSTSTPSPGPAGGWRWPHRRQGNTPPPDPISVCAPISWRCA